MILSLALSITLMASGHDTKPLVCPMTGEDITAGAATIDFAGTRYSMCCGGCPDGFKKDPTGALKSEKLVGKTTGVFLFDPVSNKRIDHKEAKGGTSDFRGTRYLFATADEKAKFDANPKQFVKAPTKEVLFCTVVGHSIKNYATAGGFVDVGNVRYYTCCADCLAKLKEDPSAYTAKGADHVKAPVAVDSPKAEDK